MPAAPRRPRTRKAAAPRKKAVARRPADTTRTAKIVFEGISARAWQHPSDTAALAALRTVPGFDILVRKLFGMVGDRPLRLAFLASAVRVTPRQLSDVHQVYREACTVLDMEPPELYVAQTPFVNAGAIGVEKPFIVLNSGTLGLLDREELQFVLGHELGHILSGHALYKTMLRLLLRMSTLALSIPMGGPALLAVAAALMEWDRCSELSADRAGLLVAQSPEIAQRTTMKMAGGSALGMDPDEFHRQAEEYRKGGNMADSVMKLMALMGRSHPFPVLRFAAIDEWVDSGDYDRICRGEYPKRKDDPRASVADDWKRASKKYADEFARSADPLAEAVRSATDTATRLGRIIVDALRDRTGR
jgi:Zn-dependent protease with chaperone function